MPKFKIFAARVKKAKRRKAIRAAVANHRAELAERGLVRIESVVDRKTAVALRADAEKDGTTLRDYIARILSEAVRR